VLSTESRFKPGEHPALDALVRAGRAVQRIRPASAQRHWEWHGDAVDVALLSFGHKLGWQRERRSTAHPQVNEIPFESEHQYAATFNRSDGG
jgi:P-type Ca2+ transporter type 2C